MEKLLEKLREVNFEILDIDALLDNRDKNLRKSVHIYLSFIWIWGTCRICV